jgi:hypothetical protein
MPGHVAVIGVAGCHDPARSTHTAHLAERSHRIVNVLKHLVRVDDVEGAALEVKGVHIALAELDIGYFDRSVVSRLLDNRFGAVDPDNATGRDSSGEVDGERPGPAPHVEDGAAGGKVINEVAGRVVDGSPSM